MKLDTRIVMPEVKPTHYGLGFQMPSMFVENRDFREEKGTLLALACTIADDYQLNLTQAKFSKTPYGAGWDSEKYPFFRSNRMVTMGNSGEFVLLEVYGNSEEDGSGNTYRHEQAVRYKKEGKQAVVICAEQTSKKPSASLSVILEDNVDEFVLAHFSRPHTDEEGISAVIERIVLRHALNDKDFKTFLMREAKNYA